MNTQNNNSEDLKIYTQGFEAAVTKLTLWSLILNITLSLVKIIVGFFLNSVSLVSDGLHSFSDLLSDFVMYFGAKWAVRPPDEDHHFGHGKYETFAQVVIALLLLGVASSIMWYGIQAVIKGEVIAFSWTVVILAGISVITKEAYYQWNKRIANQYNSKMLLANAWHSRSDAFSSVIVILGMVLTKFGLPGGDAWAGIIVGILIALMGLDFLKKGINELSESAPDTQMLKDIRDQLSSHPDVRSFHRLRVRRLGSQLHMDMHLVLDENLSLKNAHEIANSVEGGLKKTFGLNTNVLVHPEPENDRHRTLGSY